MLLQELWSDISEEQKDSKKEKKQKRDKSADKYRTYVAGNMLMNQTCSSDLSGTKKISTDTRI
jgi:hypothetical protein